MGANSPHLLKNLIMAKKPLVYLDYGHYSGIPGHCSPDGKVVEAEVVRNIGRHIVKSLKKYNIEVKLIHPEDGIIGSPLNDLSVRSQRANTYYNTDKDSYECVFISLHVDADGSSTWTAAHGCTFHIAPNSSTKSRALAESYRDVFTKYLLTGNRKSPVRYSDFSVLLMTEMPAILVENLFMNNHEDCIYLLDETKDNVLVEPHVVAIWSYFMSLGDEIEWVKR